MTNYFWQPMSSVLLLYFCVWVMQNSAVLGIKQTATRRGVKKTTSRRGRYIRAYSRDIAQILSSGLWCVCLMAMGVPVSS